MCRHVQSVFVLGYRCQGYAHPRELLASTVVQLRTTLLGICLLIPVMLDITRLALVCTFCVNLCLVAVLGVMSRLHASAWDHGLSDECKFFWEMRRRPPGVPLMVCGITCDCEPETWWDILARSLKRLQVLNRLNLTENLTSPKEGDHVASDFIRTTVYKCI